jgi:hypothetical protein
LEAGSGAKKKGEARGEERRREGMDTLWSSRWRSGPRQLGVARGGYAVQLKFPWQMAGEEWLERKREKNLQTPFPSHA